MAVERSVLVRLRADAGPFAREMVKARAAVAGLRDEIDTTNDRSAWMAQGILAVGPAAVTMGATAVPVLAGLATQATVGTAAIGTMLLAFNGVGDALKALNTYQLEPTAANLAKLDDAMSVLGTDGEQFVRVLDQVGDKLSVLGMDARAGMFPGMADGLESLLSRLPQLRTIVTQIAEGVGQLFADAGRGLSGSGFDEFFEFLETDAKPILIDTGRALGNFVQGFASLLVDFAPLTRSFTGGLLDMSRGFAEWAEGLDDTRGFQDFLQYIEDNGPAVVEMFGALGNVVVELAKAAAPVGAIMVPALEALADAVALIADTPVGSLLVLGAALTSLYGRVVALRSIAGGPIMGSFTAEIGKSAKAAKAAVPSLNTWGAVALRAGQSSKYMTAETRAARAEVGAFAKAAGPAAARLGLLGVAMSPLPQQAGLSNTAMGAMAGTLAGPWGAAVGAGVGLLLDFGAASGNASNNIAAMQDAIDSLDVDALEAQLDAFEAANAKYLDGDWTFGDTLSAGWKDLISGGGFSDEVEAAGKLPDALRRAREAANDAKFAHMGLSDALVETGRDAVGTSSELLELAGSTNAASAAAWSAFDAQTRLGESLDGVAEAADKGKRGLDDSTDAGRENRAALSALAGSWAATKTAMEDNGASARAIERRYLEVRGALVDAAIEMGATREKARRLAEQLDKPMSIIIKEQHREAVASAKAAIAELRRSIEGHPITQRVIVLNGKRVTAKVGTPGGVEQLLGGNADGGTIPGQRAPYRDKVLSFLAPGEEVISNRNGQADRWRPVLKAINANALALGGTVGAAPRITTTSAPTVEARAVRDTAVALKALAREAKASEKSLSKLRSRRESLLSARNDLRSSVSEGLQSDLWSSDAWSSSDPLSILRGDIRNAKAFRAGANTLRDKGVTGAALAEILRSGDLSRVQQMASMTKGQLTEYRQLFSERARELGAAGGRAGDVAYGPVLGQITRELREIRAEVKRSSHKNSGEHKADRDAQRRGAGNAASSRNRGYVPA